MIYALIQLEMYTASATYDISWYIKQWEKSLIILKDAYVSLQLLKSLFSTSVDWRMPDILLGLIETEMGHESIINPDTLSWHWHDQSEARIQVMWSELTN